MRKIFDAAGVVEIEVGEHDVAHIFGLEAQRLELTQRGRPFVQSDAVGDPEKPAEPPRLPDILQSEPGIDEDEPDLGLDQQTMTTIVAAPRRGVKPSHSLPPKGHIAPQLMW